MTGRRRARVIALSGFLGAGKTTTLAAMARRLERRGSRVAVVTNDQGRDLVDTRVAAAAGVDVSEVTGGCFCCRFEDLADVVSMAVERNGADVVLAEAVGSCTDLSATVARPLRRTYGDVVEVAPLTAVVDPARFTAFDRSLSLTDPGDDLAYLFDRQLADADVIAVNKIDLAPQAEIDAVRASVHQRHRHARVVPYSAATGQGLDTLEDLLLDGRDLPERDIEIDYDRYAAAEAELAWLNHRVLVQPAAQSGTFASATWGHAVLSSLGRVAVRNGWQVGHAKLVIEPPEESSAFTKLSLVAAGSPPMLDVDGGAMRRAGVRVNARIACRPDQLDAAITAAIRAGDDAADSQSVAEGEPTSFAPMYPRPQYRLPATPS